MEEYALLVKNLCKKFDGFELDHVSFQVPTGRIVGFIGENGAGKSTTIRLITNELKKDGGDIHILGEPYTKLSAKEQLGVVFDGCNFHEVFTPDQAEKILSNIYASWDSPLYHQYLERFRLPHAKPLMTFSKGMKMKFAIVCALAHRPRLLIMDEATSGLDPVVREEILDLFWEFIQEEDHSIFFSSHITSDIQKIADYVVLIHQGKIVFEEEKDRLIDNYGMIRCTQRQFASLAPEDYLAYRQTSAGFECLVSDKEAARKKYSPLIIDSASLEDIMLLYTKNTRNSFLRS